MAVSVDTIYKRCQMIANKSQVGGYLNVEDFNEFANMASLSIINQQFQIFQKLQKVTDILSPFVKRKQTWINSSTGLLQYPADYMYLINLRTYKQSAYLALKNSCIEGQELTADDYKKIPQIPIKLIDSDKLAVLNQSDKYTPNYEYPYAEETLNGFYIYPLDLGYALLTYLKKPATVIWNYTTDIYGLPVFTSTGSVDFDYDDTASNMLVMEICKHFGIEIRDADLVQATSQLEATGE
jgi:hypothetical protein